MKAANVDVEPYWPSLFAKALEGVDVKNLISNIGSGAGAAPAAGAAAPAAAAGGKTADYFHLASELTLISLQLLHQPPPRRKRRRRNQKPLTTTWASVFSIKFLGSSQYNILFTCTNLSFKK